MQTFLPSTSLEQSAKWLNRRDGWDSIGNEIDGRDIREALAIK